MAPLPQGHSSAEPFSTAVNNPIPNIHIGESTPLHLKVEIALLPSVRIKEGIEGVIQPVNRNPDCNGQFRKPAGNLDFCEIG